MLNITSSEEHPYFFGLGLASRYDCNYGFKESVGSELAQKMDIRIKMKKSGSKMNIGAIKNHDKELKLEDEKMNPEGTN